MPRRRAWRWASASSVAMVIFVSLIAYTVPREASASTSPDAVGGPPSMTALESKYCMAAMGQTETEFGSDGFVAYYSDLEPLSSSCGYDHYGGYAEIENLTSHEWSTIFVAVNQTSTEVSSLNVTYTEGISGSSLWFEELNQSGQFSYYSCSYSTMNCTPLNSSGDVVATTPAASCTPSSTTVYGVVPWVYEKYNQCATAKVITWLDDGEIEAFIGAIATWGTPASWALLIVAWFLFIGQNFVSYADSQGSPANSGVYVAGTLARHCVLIWCWTEYTPVYGWGNPPP